MKLWSKNIMIGFSLHNTNFGCFIPIIMIIFETHIIMIVWLASDGFSFVRTHELLVKMDCLQNRCVLTMITVSLSDMGALSLIRLGDWALLVIGVVNVSLSMNNWVVSVTVLLVMLFTFSIFPHHCVIKLAESYLLVSWFKGFHIYTLYDAYLLLKLWYWWGNWLHDGFIVLLCNLHCSQDRDVDMG